MPTMKNAVTPAMLKVLRACTSGRLPYAHPSINSRYTVSAKRACVRRGLLTPGPQRIGRDGFGVAGSEKAIVTDAGLAALAAAR